MDFIERWLGFSPDGGDGTAELIWIAAVVGFAVLAGLRWMARRRTARRHGQS